MIKETSNFTIHNKGDTLELRSPVIHSNLYIPAYYCGPKYIYKTFQTETEFGESIQTKFLKAKTENGNQNISVNFPHTKINMKKNAIKCCKLD